MAITTEREFCPADRYRYDFGICSAQNGWAQLDTGQDASYYGTWLNPSARQILTYCEGDQTLVKMDTDAELVAEVAEIRRWNTESGHRFIGLDPGFSVEVRAAIIAAGLAQFLHESDPDRVVV